MGVTGIKLLIDEVLLAAGALLDERRKTSVASASWIEMGPYLRHDLLHTTSARYRESPHHGVLVDWAVEFPNFLFVHLVVQGNLDLFPRWICTGPLPGAGWLGDSVMLRCSAADMADARPALAARIVPLRRSINMAGTRSVDDVDDSMDVLDDLGVHMIDVKAVTY